MVSTWTPVLSTVCAWSRRAVYVQRGTIAHACIGWLGHRQRARTHCSSPRRTGWPHLVRVSELCCLAPPDSAVGAPGPAPCSRPRRWCSRRDTPRPREPGRGVCSRVAMVPWRTKLDSAPPCPRSSCAAAVLATNEPAAAMEVVGLGLDAYVFPVALSMSIHNCKMGCESTLYACAPGQARMAQQVVKCTKSRTRPTCVVLISCVITLT